jgi:hypothetical protein
MDQVGHGENYAPPKVGEINFSFSIRFQILTAVKTLMLAFWVVTPCFVRVIESVMFR